MFKAVNTMSLDHSVRSVKFIAAIDSLIAHPFPEQTSMLSRIRQLKICCNLVYFSYLIVIYPFPLDDNYDTSEREGAEADTLNGSQGAVVIASDTKWPYADPLYTNIKTKPQGSGGE